MLVHNEPTHTVHVYDTVRRSWGVAQQKCTWCQAVKPVGEFWRNRETGWITRECRACAMERERLWAEVERRPVVVGRRYVDEGDGAIPCTRCGRHLPRSSFYTYKSRQDDRRRYYRPKCKQCMGAEQNAAKARHSVKPQRRAADRDRWLRKKYGIGLDEYAQLLDKQSGKCAICSTTNPGGPTPESAFHVDHCHESGNVRGLLCRACNTAIGLLREDHALFATAARYLESAQ